MKKNIICFLKVMLSGIVALIILSALSLIYHNPSPTIPQPEEFTKNRGEPNRFWSYMGEGFGYGVTDNLGYNNAYYTNCTDPDVVVVGSSHMEATSVPADKNCTYLMNKNFNEDDRTDNDFKCLSIGRSGSFFDQSVSYFESVVNKFDSAKYIVVETKSLGWTAEQLEGMLNRQYRPQMLKRSVAGNIAVAVPYFRIMSKQLKELFLKNGSEEVLPVSTSQDTEKYAQKMNEVIKMLSTQAKENGKKLIILHHNTFDFYDLSNPKSDDDAEQVKVLEDSCKENDATFVNVIDEFISHYQSTYELPYGFSNSQIGEGHLNKVGHRIIADELYKAINSLSDTEK